MPDTEVTITLPFPPTVNTYWRRNGNRYFVSDKGKAYRNRVMDRVLEAGRPSFGDARLFLDVTLHRGDRRSYDIDNMMKGLIDSLQSAGVFDDDSQIDELNVLRGERRGGGQAVVTIGATEVSQKSARDTD